MSSSYPPLAPALTAAIVGIVLSFVIAFIVCGWEERTLYKALQQSAEDRVEVLRGQLIRSMEVLHAITSLYAVHKDVTRAEFRAFVSGPLTRQPELQARPGILRGDPGGLRECFERGPMIAELTMGEAEIQMARDEIGSQRRRPREALRRFAVLMEVRKRETETEIADGEIGRLFNGLPKRGGRRLVLTAIEPVPAGSKRAILCCGSRNLRLPGGGRGVTG